MLKEVNIMANNKKCRSLDRIDRNILRELQLNARLSYVELADKVGLSTSPCLERVKRLENDGWIESYNAKLSAEKLESALLVFVEISLNYKSGSVFDDFRESVERWPEIQECHLVSGDFDYLLKIRITDMVAYRDLLGQIVSELPGVRDSKTLVAMETVKESSEVIIKEA